MYCTECNTKLLLCLSQWNQNVVALFCNWRYEDKLGSSWLTSLSVTCHHCSAGTFLLCNTLSLFILGLLCTNTYISILFSSLSVFLWRELVNSPSGINKVLSCLLLSYLTLVVVLLSGLQGSCAATTAEPWVDPDDPWPWAWLWESLLWEMDGFFFRGRPFRLGAGGQEAVTMRIGGSVCADAALCKQITLYFHLCCQH